MNDIKYYKDLIKKYEKLIGDSYYNNSFTQYVCEQKTIEDAIKVAVLARNKNGKMFGHQCCIKYTALLDYIKKLLTVKNKIKNSKTFNELYNILSENRVYGIGDLTVYDTTLRLSQYFKLFPDYIYIHAGTKLGLEIILDKKVNQSYIKKEELPEPFCSCNLIPLQLEDLFCWGYTYMTKGRLKNKNN